MKRLVAFIMAACLITTPALAKENAQSALASDANGWRCGSAQEIIDLDLQKNNVRINNISIKERDEHFGSGRVVEFSFAIANRQENDIRLDGQLAGFDRDAKLIFTIHAEPIMSMVSGWKTVAASGGSYSMRGELQRVDKVCVKFMGQF